jgi:hypothetical protein
LQEIGEPLSRRYDQPLCPFVKDDHRARFRHAQGRERLCQARKEAKAILNGKTAGYSLADAAADGNKSHRCLPLAKHFDSLQQARLSSSHGWPKGTENVMGALLSAGVNRGLTTGSDIQIRFFPTPIKKSARGPASS